MAQGVAGANARQAILSGQPIDRVLTRRRSPRRDRRRGVPALAGLSALGLGAIARNTASGIATFAAVMFVIPPLITILPSSIASSITPYLPSNACDALMPIGHHANTLSPGAGLAVLQAT